MRTFSDLYTNKLMNISFTVNKGKEVFENQIGNHYPGDYGEVKKILEKSGLTTAFYIENINEICIDVPEGWIIFDAWGEPVGAGGKYEKFMELNSGVTELEEIIRNDVSDIYASKYDVVYALDFIDAPVTDKYLIGESTHRDADCILNERTKLPTKYYFLTWGHESCHDGDEWVAIVSSMDELKKIYEKTLKESDSYYESNGLKLKAYEYKESFFAPISIL